MSPGREFKCPIESFGLVEIICVYVGGSLGHAQAWD